MAVAGTARVPVYVSTGRGVLAEAEERGWPEAMRRAGARFVVDTCTYITPILDAPTGKRGHDQLGQVGVVCTGEFGCACCLRDPGDRLWLAVAGRVVRNRPGWLDD